MAVNLAAPLRAALLGASRNAFLRRNAARYGMRLGARRFVAGTTLAEFVATAGALNATGALVSAAILGEGTATVEAASAVVAAYEELLDAIVARALRANVALKLTHLGLGVDPELAFAHLRRLLDCARTLGNTIRIDMEESAHVDVTLATYERLRSAGYDNVGIVLQAYLYRSEADLRRLLPLAPNVRLVKGAYLEPPSLAFPKKSDVDRNFLHLIELALDGCAYCAIATHDELAIRRALAFATSRGISARGRFEFQMLYGIRPELQRRLLAERLPLRVAVPFGADWYPYFMRRLAERPANLAFVLRSLAG